MYLCTWALNATTVHKEKVYVLRLKLTHTALVNTYIWTIRHFDCGDELERDWKRKFLKMERQFSIGPENFHLGRTVPFTFGPKFPEILA